MPDILTTLLGNGALLALLTAVLVGCLVAVILLARRMHRLQDNLSRANAEIVRIGMAAHDGPGDNGVGHDVAGQQPPNLRRPVSDLPAHDLPLETNLARVERRLQTVTEARNALQALSITDPLTGLINRRGLEEQLSRWMTPPGGLDVLTAMHVDLDHFKVVNDTLGHDAGDHVLQVVGRRMRTAVRDNDVIARVGGDEFVILLPQLDDLGQLAQIAMRIVASLHEPINHDGRTAQIGGSIGIAVGGELNGVEDPEELLKNADLAAFKSKAGGRGRFSVFDQRMRSYIEHQRSMAERLTAALQDDHIEAWLQPVFDVHTNRMISVEALARWHDPKLGIVSAEDFIEIATQRNLITDIGTAVIARASRAVAAWERQGFAIPQVSFNLSDQEMKSVEIVDQIKWALELAELAPEKVAIELDPKLSEQRGAELAVEHIYRLRRLGISVIVDDADFDRPSSSDLKRLGASVVKLSRKLVDSLLDDDSNMLRLQRQIELFRTVEIEVIGKAVNSKKLADKLTASGCVGLQGLHIAAPMSLVQFGDWLVAEGGQHGVGRRKAAGR